MMRRSKDIILYPYNNQTNVPTLGAEETPKFLYRKFGFPITATFNKGYYHNVKLLEFKLYCGKKEVNCKIVSSKNDINNKIRKNNYVLVPLNRLKSKTKYKVFLKASVNGKIKTKRWSFTTR
jgi:hypothetical protein